MTTEVVTLEGPLPAERLQWVADLYGPVDPRYREAAQLEHVFVNSPAGPALHAFALDRGRPVAHCAVVPMDAREGDRPLLVGKVEALVVEEAYRGRRAGAPPLAVELRTALYAAADAHGIQILHAYVRPEVGRVLALSPVRSGAPSRVLVLDASGIEAARLRRAARPLSFVQRALVAVAGLVTRPSQPSLRAPGPQDADLVESPAPGPGTWTVLADDVWEWVQNAPSLRVVELDASRMLVHVPSSSGDALRVVGWRPVRMSIGGAVAALVVAARLAAEAGASTLRYQPLRHDAASDALVRASRLLGFVARDDFATLYVRANDPELARSENVVPSPLAALGF